MLASGWRDAILMAVDEHNQGDSEFLFILGDILTLYDEAEQALRDKGYGYLNLEVPETIRQMTPHADHID